MDQYGAPLPGEDASWFQARQIKERFREDQLASLLKTLGVDAFNAGFYGSEGVLIERHGPTAAGYREYSLSEVQAQWSE